MTHGSLFTGIGGFDLAAEWMGWTNVFHCEKDDKARALLHKRFPNVKSHDDIFNLNAKQYEGKIDIITGGFPCQPFSVAGKRRGADDDRYLWPEMLRVIREIKPSYIVGENVGGLTTMDDGKTFDDIWTSLENEGYTIEAFILPAAAVQAWHRRDRIWICAYSNSIADQAAERRSISEEKSKKSSYEQIYSTTRNTSRAGNQSSLSGNDTNPSQTRTRMEKLGGSRQKREPTDHMEREVVRQENREASTERTEAHHRNAANTYNTGERTSRSNSDRYRTQDEQEWKNKSQPESSGYCKDAANTYKKRLQRDGQCRKNKRWENTKRYFGQSSRTWTDWTTEPRVGRVAHGIPNRVDRLKQLGNAIVPQVAYEIFKAIDKLNNEIIKA